MLCEATVKLKPGVTAQLGMGGSEWVRSTRGKEARAQGECRLEAIGSPTYLSHAIEEVDQYWLVGHRVGLVLLLRTIRTTRDLGVRSRPRLLLRRGCWLSSELVSLGRQAGSDNGTVNV